MAISVNNGTKGLGLQGISSILRIKGLEREPKSLHSKVIPNPLSADAWLQQETIVTTKLLVTYRARKAQEHRHAMVNTLTACCPGEASVYLASSILFHNSYS